jgi:hypothetical protein
MLGSLVEYEIALYRARMPLLDSRDSSSIGA